MSENPNLSVQSDLVPISRAAARFGYTDPRHFRRFAAQQRFGLTVVELHGRHFIRESEIRAFWERHEQEKLKSA